MMIRKDWRNSGEAMEAKAGALLAWYDAHRRELPWRAPPGERPEPYPVWLSEIMLQQTVAAAVGPYFRRFVERWPDVGGLAAASLDEVLQAWQGLGYYARARNLHAAARIVASRHGGRFPDSEAGLRALPGIGAYTAAAIAAIAFDRRATVVDGNVERVMARLFRIETPLPAAKKAIRSAAAGLTPDTRPGDYAQAVMDLGATVCLPRRPRCGACPWSGACRGRAAGIAGSLPVKPPKRERPVRRGIAYWTEDGAGRVLLRRRPETGLLGGMMEVPSGPWVEDGPPPEAPPLEGAWAPLGALARHGFTHFVLELDIRTGTSAGAAPEDCVWAPIDALDGYALPTAMKKVVRLALAGRDRLI